MIAQYVLGLAQDAKSPADYLEKLRETEALDINEKIISFAQELFNKVTSHIVSCSNCANNLLHCYVLFPSCFSHFILYQLLKNY